MIRCRKSLRPLKLPISVILTRPTSATSFRLPLRMIRGLDTPLTCPMSLSLGPAIVGFMFMITTWAPVFPVVPVRRTVWLSAGPVVLLSLAPIVMPPLPLQPGLFDPPKPKVAGLLLAMKMTTLGVPALASVRLTLVL